MIDLKLTIKEARNLQYILVNSLHSEAPALFAEVNYQITRQEMGDDADSAIVGRPEP